MDSRREFLKKAGLLSGALAMSNVIPMSIQRAMAIQADPGTTFYDAEHVVFLMQENRSFDHFFGAMRGVRGFNDPRAKRLPNGNKVWLQNDAKGQTFAPFHVDMHKTKITWQGGLPHSWSDQVAARNKGKYDKWVPVKSLMSLGYYQREDIPFYYAMADAFTVCDQHFCSSLTGTTPNRLFFWTGTIRPEQNANAVAAVNNEQAESRDNVFVDWQTFPELLEDNGISWKVYQNELWTADVPGDEVDNWLGNYGDNPLEYVKRHRVKLSAYFRKNGDKTSHPALSAEEVMARYVALSPREKALIDKAFTTNIDASDYLELAPFSFKNAAGVEETIRVPKGDIFGQFRKDVDNGKLPAVSWLVAPQHFSDHTSTPLYGVWYVSEALDILTKNPEVWKKTIFILTYDENDGYFDHIPPFVAPRPDDSESGAVSKELEPWADYEFHKNSPIGLGYRVPMIVASPWSKGGFVNSQVFDHTSSLMFLENWLGRKTGKLIKSDNISPWRRAVCGDLSSVFRPFGGEKFSSPDSLRRDAVISAIQAAKSKPAQATPPPLSTQDIEKMNQLLPFMPGASVHAPVQEKGQRPACALPYYLQVNAMPITGRKEVQLRFEAQAAELDGNKGVGSAFNVYTPGIYKEDAGRTWAYAVKAGDALTDNWSLAAFKNGIYDLHVHGPNGFFRAFKGSVKSTDLTITCHADKNTLQFTLHWQGQRNIDLQMKDVVYSKKMQVIRLAPGTSKVVVWDTQKHQGWYDLGFNIKGDADFYYQYAGHLENGQESFSDPFMGGMSALASL